MAFANIALEDGEIDCTLFADHYSKYKADLIKDQMALFTLQVGTYQSQPSFSITQITPIL